MDCQRFGIYLCLSDGIIEMTNTFLCHLMINLQPFNGDGFYEQLIIVFIICNFDHITRELSTLYNMRILAPEEGISGNDK